jgi:hypothetical protein
MYSSQSVSLWKADDDVIFGAASFHLATRGIRALLLRRR